MNIPRYWAHSVSPPTDFPCGPMKLACWRWSNISQADAKQQADAHALQLPAKFLASRDLDRYSYSDRPLREEIIRTIPCDGQTDSAIVTRNIYGALILNTSRSMFIDIDFPAPGVSGRVNSLFRRMMKKTQSNAAEQQCLAKVADRCAQHPQLGLRVYRTFAGLRCLITNQLFDPSAPETTAMLNEFGSDPLYIRLCKAQSCFRARLTPKPWRCGSRMPPVRYPWKSADHESRFRRWQSDYEHSSKPFSVCRFLQHFGSPDTHPELQTIIALHDEFTCGKADQPMA